MIQKFIFPTILLVVIISIACKDDDKTNTLEYTKCPCDHEVIYIKEISRNTILLFDGSKTSFAEMKELSFDDDHSEFIFFSPSGDSLVFCSIYSHMNGISYVCNIPLFIFEWTIPSEGIYVSFSSDEYELCEPMNSIGSSSYSNLVLTTFNKI